ncbi:MAG: hypothetical protein U0R24_03790 [Solirubrobacterales bacterium]
MVEAVEAATIVLAMGVTRGWRSAFTGLAAALVALALVVAAMGPALEALPLDVLRLIVGTLLLIFGLQWLRKAALREAGLIPLHDEEVAYEREREAAERVGRRRGFAAVDPYAFTVTFKSSFLEGLEVAFIALTFGSNAGDVPLAAATAVAAAIFVAGVAIVTRGPLTRVPENQLKLAVSVLLTSFGLYWGVEGAGADWPGGEVALLALLPVAAGSAWLLVNVSRRRLISAS